MRSVNVSKFEESCGRTKAFVREIDTDAEEVKSARSVRARRRECSSPAPLLQFREDGSQALVAHVMRNKFSRLAASVASIRHATVRRDLMTDLGIDEVRKVGQPVLNTNLRGVLDCTIGDLGSAFTSGDRRCRERGTRATGIGDSGVLVHNQSCELVEGICADARVSGTLSVLVSSADHPYDCSAPRGSSGSPNSALGTKR